MSTVNNISPIDGSAYLVSTGNSVNATSGTDFDKIYNDKIGRASCRERV